MTFNTSGMITNWRTDVGGYAGLQAVGPALGAGRAEAGILGGQQLELPAWHSSGPTRGWHQLREDQRAARPGRAGRQLGNSGCEAYKRLGRPGRLQGCA